MDPKIKDVLSEEEEAIESRNPETEEALPTEDDFEIVMDEGDDKKPEAEAEDVENEEESAEASDDDPDTSDDDAADDTDTADADDEEDDGVKYSKKVQKRIQREVRLRRQVEEAAAQAQKERDDLIRERVSQQIQMDQLQENYIGTLEQSIESTYAQKAAELKRAKEEADTDAEIKLSGEISDLAYQKRQLMDIKSNFQAAAAKRKEDIQRLAATKPHIFNPQQAGPQTPQNPLTAKWLARNKWFTKPDFAPEAAAARAIDAQLTREGFSQQDPQYFRELDKRIAKKFPSLVKKKPPISGKTPSSPVAPVVSGVTSKGGKKVVRLTKEDVETMRRFKIDINDKQAVMMFARQKMPQEN